MPKVTHHLGVNAPLQTIWNVLLDKIEHPDRYLVGVQEVRFPENEPEYVLREMVLGQENGIVIRERITIDEAQGQIRFQLVDDPLFEGDVINALIPPANDDPKATPVVQFTMNWTPRNNEAEAIEVEQGEELEASVREAVQYVKDLAEHMSKQESV